MNSGKVIIIGAGPGHPELITLLAHRKLQEADVVIYDDLVPFEIIAQLPANIERLYVGKRASKHSKSQKEINELIVSHALDGKTVARLKGGDPFIFGRGGEELEAIKQSGISFEVIPGVTAMNAAAAGAGIPVTDRRFASYVTMLTGHDAISDSPNVDWKQMATLFNGTLAIYMGTKNLTKIVSGLLQGGLNPNTPCSIVIDAYNPSQFTINGDLTSIVEDAKSEGLRSPAIILIGEATRNTEKFSWKKSGRLSGKRVLVTRPQLNNERLCSLLREEGAVPIPLPAIGFKEHFDHSGWGKIHSHSKQGGWLVFTSATGVHYFHQQLLQNNFDIRFYGNYKIAAIGSGTSIALNRIGLLADFIPDEFTVASLTKELPTEIKKSGLNRVVRVRGNLSIADLEIQLEKHGVSLLLLTVYETFIPDWESHWCNQIAENPPDFTTITSGSTFEGIIKILGSETVRELSRNSKFVSIGPGTTKVMRNHGMEPSIEALMHNDAGLLEAIISMI